MAICRTMARLQTFHARMIPKTASSIFRCVAASLFHVLVPANRLPSLVFVWRPCNSAGTWLGAFGASVFCFLLKLFLFGDPCTGVAAGAALFSILWIGVRCTLILGSFIRRRTSWSSGGSWSADGAFNGPVCSAARRRNISWSARSSWSIVMGLKFGTVSAMRARKSLLLQSVCVSQEMRPTRIHC